MMKAFLIATLFSSSLFIAGACTDSMDADPDAGQLEDTDPFPLPLLDGVIAFGRAAGCVTLRGELRCWTTAGVSDVLFTDVARLEGDGADGEPLFLASDGRLFRGAIKPVLVNVGPFIDLNDSSCALRPDGTVFCENGDEHEGAYLAIDGKATNATFCGVDASTGAVHIERNGFETTVFQGPFVRVACNPFGAFCALRSEGSVFCNRFSSLNGGGKFSAIDAHFIGGVNTLCGVDADRHIVCRNDLGSVGGAFLGEFVDVDVGDPSFVCALGVDDRVLCGGAGVAPAF